MKGFWGGGGGEWGKYQMISDNEGLISNMKNTTINLQERKPYHFFFLYVIHPKVTRGL